MAGFGSSPVGPIRYVAESGTVFSNARVPGRVTAAWAFGGRAVEVIRTPAPIILDFALLPPVSPHDAVNRTMTGAIRIFDARIRGFGATHAVARSTWPRRSDDVAARMLLRENRTPQVLVPL